MSENTETGNLPTFVSSLAIAVNSTYSYASSASLFSAVVPTYLKDYATRYIMPCCQWLDGYVFGFHDGTTGIPSTRIANSLLTGITRQIVGEKIIFKSADDNYELAKKTLDFVSRWVKDCKILSAIYSGIGFASGLGTSTVKMNKTIDGKIWWEAVRLDNSFILTDFKGEIIEATFNIKTYTDTRRGKETQSFFLVERRYYDICNKPLLKVDKNGITTVVRKKGEKTPMVVYEVYRTNGTSMNNTMATTTGKGVNWQELPQNIRTMIKNDYSVIRVGEPVKLGFINLGAALLKRSHQDLSVPTAGSFGQSMIINLISEFITYEYANACRLRDMYLGKGNVYQPKNTTMGDLARSGGIDVAKHGILSSMPESPMTLIPGVDPDKQKIFSEQFEVRGDQWQNIMNDCLKTIATKLGMTPKVIAAYLSGGAMQQTATQIDSEDDQNIAFINLERSFYKEPLNKLLETTLAFYGYPCNISMEFASPSLLNKDRLLERVIKEREEGLIDIEEAIRILNPDLEENALRHKVKVAKFLQEQKSNEVNDLDPFSGLMGDEEE